MRKTKRLLSVHPFDFELDSEYSAQSRRQSMQLSPAASSPDAFQPSLSKGSPWNEQPQSRYSADMDTSDEDVKGAQFPAYPPHHTKRRSRASSQDNVSHSGNQDGAIWFRGEEKQ
ncbi:melanophilin isoform x3 [Limosa lapponica baueri]|uniref:Melanophilin isoform x3 n=1 Tax=Limosa lapponica baueri TaxID=1758121 RepID=A0A2I0T568_LIMLA|nr:melanophilin isoform x3 [Limosa lapponica baueri]